MIGLTSYRALRQLLPPESTGPFQSSQVFFTLPELLKAISSNLMSSSSRNTRISRQQRKQIERHRNADK